MMNEPRMSFEDRLALDDARFGEVKLCAPPPAMKSIDPEKIIPAVAHYYHVTVDEITGHLKSRSVFHPRMVAMYLMRELLRLSHRELAVLFKRDQSTLSYDLLTAHRTIARDRVLFRQTGELIRIIEAA